MFAGAQSTPPYACHVDFDVDALYDSQLAISGLRLSPLFIFVIPVASEVSFAFVVEHLA